MSTQIASGGYTEPGLDTSSYKKNGDIIISSRIFMSTPYKTPNKSVSWNADCFGDLFNQFPHISYAVCVFQY